MAKMKTFAVEVEITKKVLLFVEARRPGGAEALVQTEEGWSEATRYHDEDEGLPRWFDPSTMKITDVRSVNV
jgi:hypothetical protein